MASSVFDNGADRKSKRAVWIFFAVIAVVSVLLAVWFVHSNTESAARKAAAEHASPQPTGDAAQAREEADFVASSRRSAQAYEARQKQRQGAPNQGATAAQSASASVTPGAGHKSRSELEKMYRPVNLAEQGSVGVVYPSPMPAGAVYSWAHLQQATDITGLGLPQVSPVTDVSHCKDTSEGYVVCWADGDVYVRVIDVISDPSRAQLVGVIKSSNTDFLPSEEQVLRQKYPEGQVVSSGSGSFYHQRAFLIHPLKRLT